MSTPDDRPAQDGKESANDTDGAAAAQEPSSRRQARLRDEFETLDREMEIADYATNERGQKRKKMPRKQSLYRTKKRKVLEKEDVRERAIEAEERRPRLRGSKVAFEDEVVKGSMIFGGEDHRVDSDEEEDNSNDGDEEYAPDDDDSGDALVEDGRAESVTDLGVGDGAGGGVTGVEDANKHIGAPANGHAALLNRSKPVRSQPASRQVDVARAKEAIKSGKSISRVMYRLKNFKSHKLAERQGDALGAHARGMHRTAIQKLGEVASAAPLSPQVYSSLGLVYENMLRERADGGDKRDREDQDDEVINGSDDGGADGEQGERQSVLSRRAIAEKAYGSYHIAALMCKKDFTLWIRAADAAMEIVDLHSFLMTMPGTPSDEIEKQRAEKKRWLEEAKNDYQAADNLQPPGISVPAKLASVQLELGNLSEALTILTDLKNKGQRSSASCEKTRRGRSELERSYNVWLLYADLMLRIGHECKQWNQGIGSNENYMFRRWLRKYSSSFDWKERRLQALSLALEAAAGSEACARLVEWMRERSSEKARPGGNADTRGGTDDDRWHIDAYETDQRTPENKENGAVGTEEEVEDPGTSNDDGADVNDTTPTTKRIPTESGACNEKSDDSSSLSAIKVSFEQDRELLLTRNRYELATFDENTAKINLPPDSEAAAIERETSRTALIKKHRSAVVALVGEYHQKQASAAAQDRPAGEAREKSSSIPPLPISASCASVCNIAALLTKQFFDLGLFHGGSLVGEAVSSYLRQRAARHDHRMNKLNNDRRDQALSKGTFQMHTSYDDINDESDASDSEDTEIDFISDDEELENSSEPDMLRSMQSGALPSELQVLYGFGLIGEGGKNYAARKALSAITDLDAEGSTEGTIDAGVSPDSAWFSFHRSMVEPLNRTSAFSLAADLFENAEEDKKNEWMPLAPLFQSHIASFEQSGFLKSVTPTSDASEAFAIRKSRYLKILHASLKMQLRRAEELVSSSNLASRGNASDIAMSLIENVIRFERVLWKDLSLNVSQTSSQVEVLKVLSGAFSILINKPGEVETSSPIFLRLRHIIALIFQVDILPSDGAGNDCVTSWQQFPLPSDWQRSQEVSLSHRVFNLCVGYAAPAVSGWKKDSFSLQALMNSSGSNFFGIKADGEQISGIVSRETELELASQWRQVVEILPGMTPLDFDGELTKAKGTSWYKGTIEKLDSLHGKEALSVCGEGRGIMLLLQLSKLCLYVAKDLEDSEREGLIKASMSILLPLSQFCLDQKLWSSDIGSNTAAQVERKEWSYFVAARSAFKGAGNEPSRKPPKQRRAAARRPQQPMPTRTQPRVQYNDSERMFQSTPLLAKVVKVSSFALLQEWTKHVSEEEGCSTARSQSMEQARLAMSGVDRTMIQLRLCSTVHTLQKASLQVASALLDVAARSECNNPFACLQQAVVFAGHGPKLGNNDDVFKKALPLESDCSPEEALMVLGRSDCLRAIHFTDEAMFLCSYVARVCGLRRNCTRAELRWTTRWRVVGVYAYMVSVAIDSTISSLLDGQAKDAVLAAWESDAKEEIGQGRSDAMSLCEDGDTDVHVDDPADDPADDPVDDPVDDPADDPVDDPGHPGHGDELLNDAYAYEQEEGIGGHNSERVDESIQGGAGDAGGAMQVEEGEYESSDDDIAMVPV